MGLGFRVSGFRVENFVFRVSGFVFRVSGFGLRVAGFGFRVSGFGLNAQGRVLSVECRVLSVECRVLSAECLGFRVGTDLKTSRSFLMHMKLSVLIASRTCSYRNSRVSVWIRPCSGRGAARAEDAQGTPTQGHISSSIVVYEDKRCRGEAPPPPGAGCEGP